MESEDYCFDAEPSSVHAAAERGGGKRRFSEEQIKSLESMFETQAKLEPRRKLQLARELGLQPRQVAIWFQNKRARWKSKQLERHHAALRADYEALLTSFESVKMEKQLLVKQLLKLNELLKRSPDGSSNNTDSNNCGNRAKHKKEDECKPGKLLADEASYPSAEQLQNWEEPASNSGYLTSNQRQCCFDGGFSPDKCYDATPPQWWEFFDYRVANPSAENEHAN